MTKTERDTLAKTLLPLFRAAVKANVQKWDAERAIECAFNKDMGDELYESYSAACVSCDSPDDAEKVVTLEHIYDLIDELS